MLFRSGFSSLLEDLVLPLAELQSPGELVSRRKKHALWDRWFGLDGADDQLPLPAGQRAYATNALTTRMNHLLGTMSLILDSLVRYLFINLCEPAKSDRHP